MPAKTNGPPPTVLMLQTDRRARACRRRLASLGLGTRITESGETALQLVARRRWAAIVVDLDHPTVDALAIAGAVRAHPPTARVPIVAICAARDPIVRELALERGCDRVLASPEPRDLVATVAALLALATDRAAA